MDCLLDCMDYRSCTMPHRVEGRLSNFDYLMHLNELVTRPPSSFAGIARNAQTLHARVVFDGRLDAG